MTDRPVFAAENTAKRPRVLHTVVDGPWGATRMAESLAMEQAARGEFQVAMAFRALRAPRPGRAAQAAALGCEEYFVPKNPKPWLTLRLVSLLRRWKPDVFFAHGYSLHLWARYAARLAGVRATVQIEHNCERYSWWGRTQSRFLDRHTARIVCVSPSVRQHLLALGATPSLIEVVPNGISLLRYPPPDFATGGRDIPLTMVARFSGQKDQATAIRAVSILRLRGIDVQLRLAGADDGGRLASCRALVADLGLGDRITFLGDAKDVPELLRRTRILVHSTHYEGLPLAVLEGMAAGCAVVASAVPGVVDFVRDNQNGCLFGEGDAEALADRIARLLKEPIQAERLARQGRADVEQHHTISTMTDQYDRLIRSILSSS